MKRDEIIKMICRAAELVHDAQPMRERAAKKRKKKKKHRWSDGLGHAPNGVVVVAWQIQKQGGARDGQGKKSG